MRDESTSQGRGAAGVTDPARWRVTEVRPLADYRLSVRFADGTSGEVDASRLILGTAPGVFAPLRDPTLFASVRIEHGAVTWPGGLDLAPDAMYAEIRARGFWTLG